MALTNSQYDELMREYNRIQLKNVHIATKREEEVYAALPELNSINDELFQHRNELFTSMLSGSNSKDIADRIAALEDKKHNLIASRFPKGYLEPVYDCTACRDTGFIDNKPCNCFKKAAIELLYRQSNHKNVNREHTFSKFNYDLFSKTPNALTGVSDYDNIKKVTEYCMNFVRDFDNTSDNIFFYGNPGVGKTYITDCIFNSLISSLHSVIYLTAVEFFTLLDNAKFDNEVKTNVSDTLYNSLLDCDLLIIDDLGTEPVNTFSQSNLFYYINDRLLREKSTIISSNLSPEALRDMYSDRVYSRIYGEYTRFKIYGRDLRLNI